MKKFLLLLSIILITIVGYSQNDYRIQAIERNIAALKVTCGITGPTGPIGLTGQGYPFFLHKYIEDLAPGDYLEIWVTASQNGVIVTPDNINFGEESK